MIAATAPPPAARRLLAQGVMAVTHQLVRGLRDGRHTQSMRELMRERRRLLSELARDVNEHGEGGPLTALRSAVAESDRTLEALIA